jgi:hypothetical protein
VKSAERRRQDFDLLPAFPWQPGKAFTRDSARELLFHLRSGRSLTLAEYVRAEEVLAASSSFTSQRFGKATTL